MFIANKRHIPQSVFNFVTESNTTCVDKQLTNCAEVTTMEKGK